MIDLLLKQLKYLNHVDIVNKCLQEALFILYSNPFISVMLLINNRKLLNTSKSLKDNSTKSISKLIMLGDFCHLSLSQLE
uniref:Uncharacterized protein n=1 Tax=Schistosoma haematobium TaxID=6185 RepID=A0A094ZJR3_SCHHA